MKLNLLESVPPFDVEFRMAYVSHRSPLQIDLKIMLEHVLHLGLCLPSSCNNLEVHSLLQDTFDDMEMRHKLEMQPKVLDVKDLKLNPRFFFRKSVWLLVTFIAAIIFMSYLAANLEKSRKVDENQNIANGLENKVKLSSLDVAIKCFNYKENKRFICSRESSAAAVNSISGLR